MSMVVSSENQPEPLPTRLAAGHPTISCASLSPYETGEQICSSVFLFAFLSTHRIKDASPQLRLTRFYS